MRSMGPGRPVMLLGPSQPEPERDRTGAGQGMSGAREPAPGTRAARDRAEGPTTVVLVDDHAGFREEARALLELDGLRVVGEAADGAGALAAVARLEPALLVLDVGLPDVSGLDLVRAFRRLVPDVVIVLISGRPASEYGGRVAASTADAYLEKGSLAPGVFAALLAGVGRR